MAKFATHQALKITALGKLTLMKESHPIVRRVNTLHFRITLELPGIFRRKVFPLCVLRINDFGLRKTA